MAQPCEVLEPARAVRADLQSGGGSHAALIEVLTGLPPSCCGAGGWLSSAPACSAQRLAPHSGSPSVLAPRAMHRRDYPPGLLSLLFLCLFRSSSGGRCVNASNSVAGWLQLPCHEQGERDLPPGISKSVRLLVEPWPPGGRQHVACWVNPHTARSGPHTIRALRLATLVRYAFSASLARRVPATRPQRLPLAPTFHGQVPVAVDDGGRQPMPGEI